MLSTECIAISRDDSSCVVNQSPFWLMMSALNAMQKLVQVQPALMYVFMSVCIHLYELSRYICVRVPPTGPLNHGYYPSLRFRCVLSRVAAGISISLFVSS